MRGKSASSSPGTSGSRGAYLLFSAEKREREGLDRVLLVGEAQVGDQRSRSLSTTQRQGSRLEDVFRRGRQSCFNSAGAPVLIGAALRLRFGGLYPPRY